MRKFQTRNQVQGLKLRDRAKETCPTAAPAQDGGIRPASERECSSTDV